jgi:acetyl/propionyl-CoA carboxylase alpha subunit
MRRALDELMIVGLPTSQSFHQLVLSEPTFASGKYDIGYMERTGDALVHAPLPDDLLQSVAVAAALAEHESRQSARPVTETGDRGGESPWLRAARQAGLQ